MPQPLPQTHFRDAHGKDRPRRMHERRGILDEFGIGRILCNLVRQRERRRVAPEHGCDLCAKLQRFAQQLFTIADILPRFSACITGLCQCAQVQNVLIFPRPNLFHDSFLRIFYYNVIQICSSSYNIAPHFSSPEFQEFAKRCKFSAAYVSSAVLSFATASSMTASRHACSAAPTARPRNPSASISPPLTARSLSEKQASVSSSASSTCSACRYVSTRPAQIADCPQVSAICSAKSCRTASTPSLFISRRIGFGSGATGRSW